jgi:hypothetical protein
MSTPGHYLELALDEAERDLYRAARECTDAMRFDVLQANEARCLDDNIDRDVVLGELVKALHDQR